jgi:hypothetical protein
VRDRSEASVTRGEGEQWRGPRSTRSHKLGLILGLALLASLVLGVTLASAIAPTVTVENAEQVEYTTARVKGTVDPGGESTTYLFQYISDAQFQENLTFGLPAFEGASTGSEGTTETAEPVTGELTGLHPGTTYHLRLFAINGAGTAEAAAAATFETKTVAPPTVTLDPVITFTGTTAHLSGTINPGAPAGNPAAFDVTWRFECSPECPGLQGGQIAADATDHVVVAEAQGLLPNVAYEVHLIAENANGPVVEGPQTFTTDAIAPQISVVHGSPLFSEATLEARINPGGLSTAYYFEYGPTAAYGLRTPVRTVPAGGLPVSVSANVAGLSSETEYHFKLVASNSVGSTPSVDGTFTTLNLLSESESCANGSIRASQQSSYLPDCRAYEMVSPVEKNGGDITGRPVGGTNGNVIAARQGGRVYYESYQAFADTEGAPVETGYLGNRSAEGWSSAGLLPPQVPVGSFLNTRFTGFTADLSRGVVGPVYGPALSPNAPPGVANLYERNFATGQYRVLTTALPPTNNLGENPIYAGSSADFSRSIFEDTRKLTPDAPSGPLNSLYESVGDEVRLVSILPDGTPAQGGGDAGGPGGASLNIGEFSHAISENGSRIFFSSPSSVGGPPASPPQLYVRKDGVSTVEVSASQRATPDPAGPQAATFRAATPDGTKVFFTSKAELTDNANTGTGDSNEDLYMFNVATGSLEDLTSDPGEPEGARVAGLVGVSAEGTRVYFIAAGVLSGGAREGAANLYLWERGAGTHLIAPLNEAGGNISAETQETPVHTARLTADGTHLLFTTTTPLLGYDNRSRNGSQCEATVPGNALCQEVYLYESHTQNLVCVSCNPNGEAPIAGSELGGRGGPAIPGLPTRNISDDGQRVFFNSSEALVPEDVNHQQDVYEWEGGKVKLISSGTSQAVSQFGDASASGEDVYFLTRQPLVAQDIDDSTDIYDAREFGGIPSQNESVPQGCTGEACRGQGAPTPAVQVPASSAVTGPGNPKPRQVQKKHSKKHKKHKSKKHKKHKSKKHKKKSTKQPKSQVSDPSASQRSAVR